ncbi:hypothetical protein AOLI_G00073180 [Acnodon oligacanthus]
MREMRGGARAFLRAARALSAGSWARAETLSDSFSSYFRIINIPHKTQKTRGGSLVVLDNQSENGLLVDVAV